MKNKNIEIIFDKNVNDFVVNKIEDDTLGARPIRRIIQDCIQDKIVNEYLNGNIVDGDIINIFEMNKEICIKKENELYKINEYI